MRGEMETCGAARELFMMMITCAEGRGLVGGFLDLTMSVFFPTSVTNAGYPRAL